MDFLGSLVLWLVLTLFAVVFLALGAYTVALERDVWNRSHLVATWLGRFPIRRRDLGEITDVRLASGTGSSSGGVFQVVLITPEGEVPLVPWQESGRAGREQEAARVLRFVMGAERVVVRPASPVLLAFGGAFGLGALAGLGAAAMAVWTWLVG